MSPLIDPNGFTACSEGKEFCAHDGHTFRYRGEEFRIAGVQVPAKDGFNCANEYDLSVRAQDELINLLNQGHFVLTKATDRDQDHWGRKLRVVTRNGVSFGEELIAKGLAKSIAIPSTSWC